MRMHTPLVGLVQDVSYRAYLNANGVKVGDVLRVTFEGPYGNTYQHDLDNGPFSFQNPALQFMAHCGAAPSRVDDCSGASITLCRGHSDEIGEYGYFMIAEQTLRSGRIALKSAEWFPRDMCPDSTEEPENDGPVDIQMREQ